ncbi:MAG: hypothetical protein LQ338_004281 [Usnochroma carphineum]|nr:MAG: hypothetical protein LQ338_004281 [Usnochroma carphineum]
MGKSRSATLVIAHHLSTHPTSSDPASALMLLRQARPMAEPNPGFMDQLHLYHRMRCPADIASHPLYQRWCYKREVQRSRERKEAVSSEFIVFEDEAAAAPAGEMSSPSSSLEKPRWDIAEGRSQGQDGGNDEGKQEDTSGEKEGGGEEEEEYRCRRCRTQLGRSGYRIPHTPPRGNKANNHNPQCAHLFLQPLSWMREVLSQGNLEGRLECPNVRCRQNVGKYGWQGMKCSCGEWVVPGISLGRGKVDVVVVRKRDRGGG